MPGSHTRIERSRVGQGAGVALSGPVKAAYSQLDGTVTGGATCLGNYDPNLAPVSRR